MSKTANNWQPIATAPKDGRYFDVWAKPFNGAPAGRFTDMVLLNGVVRFPSISSVPGLVGAPLAAVATHWMRIEPPTD